MGGGGQTIRLFNQDLVLKYTLKGINLLAQFLMDSMVSASSMRRPEKRCGLNSY
jgi:hypothetical protein